ncbi:hypothetical protein GNF80_10010 [Clostridium perfringens]|nr:hypothetical protein [Clostridium perfringens]
MIKVLEVNGRQFPLKFNMGVLRRMGKNGINTVKLFEALQIQDLDVIYMLFKEMLIDKKQYDEEFLDELSFEDFTKVTTIITELIKESMPKEDNTSKKTKKK